MSRKFSIGLANIFCSVTEQQKYSQYSRLSKISLQSCEGKKLQVQLSSIRLLCSSSHGHKKTTDYSWERCKVCRVSLSNYYYYSIPAKSGTSGHALCLSLAAGMSCNGQSQVS